MGTARYSGEFKWAAVALVESSGRHIGSVARGLGVNPEPLRQWVARSRAEAAASGAGGEGLLNPAEREELRRLRKQVRELEKEREILRKTAGSSEAESSGKVRRAHESPGGYGRSWSRARLSGALEFRRSVQQAASTVRLEMDHWHPGSLTVFFQNPTPPCIMV
ncbi:transposase [Streptomyces sp. NPDC048295]|uniref:transposase n=1 Tax=Streptomyces sp. NPDC048295 TaxID=3154617 RepID=UPI00344525BA